jgi:hypothetical protein|nr:MAG TPA: hypothetical protein [Caudoviricetes sp.]
MTDWPTAPLIKVVRGRDLGELKENMIAARIDDTGNYIGARCVFASEVDRDSIDEWEDVTAVPTAALKRLRDERGRETSLHNLRAAIDDVLESLPADKPSALDRAVTRVKDIAGAPMVDAETLPAERLSLLMDALASVQSAARKTAPLTMVARICADWVQADKEEVVAVEQMRSRARSMPEVIGSDPARFLVLAGIVGETASMLGDGHPSVSGELINAGTYALAWAAQTIEEEEDK